MEKIDEINEILVEVLAVDKEKIIPTAQLVDDLGADSLDLADLVLRFEDRFTIIIPDNEAEHIATVQDIYDKINEKLQ